MAVGVDAGASGGWDGMGEQVVGVVSERVRRRKGEDGRRWWQRQTGVRPDRVRSVQACAAYI